MIKKLMNLDRRIIFLLVLLAVIIPLIKPLGLELKTSPPVESIYSYIENLPEGSVILMSFDYSPSTRIELTPAAEAMARHAFRKNHKIVAVALWPDGAQMSRGVLANAAREYGKEYGKDYVNLGYKSGGSVLLMSLRSGFAANFPTDVDGIPITDLPLMNEVKDYSQVALASSFSAGVPGMKEYVLIVSTQFGVQVAAACTAVSAPEMYTFLNSGQLMGLMGGLKGAAEYEKLMEFNGEARKAMDAQSVVHLMIVLFIVFSNVIYFIDEYQKKQAG
ncbi:MAG: hypothetical protein ACLFQV_08515 [Vulcanimicrobiota bacterium]